MSYVLKHLHLIGVILIEYSQIVLTEGGVPVGGVPVGGVPVGGVPGFVSI